MLKVMKEEKSAKLLQYGERIWNIDGDVPADEKSRLAIEKTREFFESMGVKTRFSDYGLDRDVIEKIIARLEAHGMIKLGEKGTVTPDVVRRVLELSL